MKLHVNIGTSGWSYRHWQNIFYPDTIKPEKYLEFYTMHFSCVELNSCFYHLPRISTVEGWLKRTPDIFFFCPKLSRYVTHELQLVNAGEAIQKFFDVFIKLKTKLGPVLIQLPPGMMYNELLISLFFETLKEKYSGYRFAIEVRNKTWINDIFFAILERFNMALVIADSGNRYPYFETVTTDFVYIRFHGREHLYASDYSDDDLFQYAEKIKRWQQEGKEVWVFFNNDYQGYAIKNAKRLREMIS